MCENTLIKDKQAPFRAEAINAFHYKRYNSCESLRQGQCFYLTWQKKHLVAGMVECKECIRPSKTMIYFELLQDEVDNIMQYLNFWSK